MLNDHNNDLFARENLVYIRLMDASEIRDLVPANALDHVNHPEDLFMVSSADGEKLAIVQGREAAFAAARAHDLKPLSVH